MEGKTAILLEMSQWNSNDLVEQIETLGHLERSRGTNLQHLSQITVPADSVHNKHNQHIDPHASDTTCDTNIFKSFILKRLAPNS